jgi:hypothetical protein
VVGSGTADRLANQSMLFIVNSGIGIKYFRPGVVALPKASPPQTFDGPIIKSGECFDSTKNWAMEKPL